MHYRPAGIRLQGEKAEQASNATYPLCLFVCQSQTAMWEPWAGMAMQCNDLAWADCLSVCMYPILLPGHLFHYSPFPHTYIRGCYLLKFSNASALYSTVSVDSLPLRKWNEIKQQPGTAGPGNLSRVFQSQTILQMNEK